MFFLTDSSGCTGATDIIFVVDRSGSICNNENVPGCDNWDAVLEFMEGLAEDLDIGADATRVGIVVYGNIAYTIVSLTDFDNEDDLIDFIRDIEYDPNKRTNTAGGIENMIDEFDANPRQDVNRIAVIITDGLSTVDSEDTIPNAERARDDYDVTIFVIGVTNDVNEDELKGMSSEPQELDRNYFMSPEFDALDEIEDAVSQAICPGTTQREYCRPGSA